MASVTMVVIAPVAEMTSRTRRSVPAIRASVLRVVDPSMSLTVPPAGVTALGGLVVTVAVRTSFWPLVSEAPGTPRVVLVGVDNNVGSSNIVTIGSIRCLNVGPHRSFVRMHPARYDFLLVHGWHCTRDLMESVLYSGNVR